MILHKNISPLSRSTTILYWCVVAFIAATNVSSSSDLEKLMTIVKRNPESSSSSVSENYFQLDTLNKTALVDNMMNNVSISTSTREDDAELYTIASDETTLSSDEFNLEDENQFDLDTIMNASIISSGINKSRDFEVFNSSSAAVDCSDFTEQKLMSIVICSTSDYMNNVNNNSEIDPINVTNILIDGLNSSQTFVNPLNDTSLTETDIDSTLYLTQVIITAVILGIIILATVIGNVFVIAAILLEKNLQSVANYLILSLAVADLLVACLVMPLSAVYEISREWKLGPELCDMWTSSDVLCCTASILHLVAIALDRYWAVTNIDYAHQRTGQRIGVMIVILWVLSFLVSIAPMFGWKDSEWNTRLENYECLVSQDIGYQVFATASSFYVPLLAILFLYWRIYLVARRRIRRRQQVSYDQQQQQQQKKQMPPLVSGSCIAQISGSTIATAAAAVIGRPLPTISEATTTTTTTAFTNLSSTNASPEKCSYDNEQSVAFNSTASYPPFQETSSSNSKLKLKQNIQHNKKSKLKPSILKRKNQNSNDSGSKRERKAAKTLAIITGAFVICWMPFFVIAVLLPICADECGISPIIISFFLWLGYFNSTLNPILYTIFNQDFRHAFMKILCGRNRRRSRRMGLQN